ncbi:MAG: DUF4402 domain-containing protein [Bacteroidota bacterium]|nr:DUF4402 domain-containing protein [Bacteroidota bacterium]
MKRVSPFMLLLTVLTVLPFYAMGEISVSTSAVAKAKIISAIKLTKVNDLNFGKIGNGKTGSVMLTPYGDRTSTGIITIGESGWSPARFEVRGTSDYEYYISLPSTVSIKNGDNVLVVNDLVAKPSTSSDEGLIGIVKSDSYFTVGGKLVLQSADLPTGVYTASFDVSVGYN